GASCLVEHDSSFAFVPPSETNGKPCETYLCATGSPRNASASSSAFGVAEDPLALFSSTMQATTTSRPSSHDSAPTYHETSLPSERFAALALPRKRREPCAAPPPESSKESEASACCA